MSTLTKQFCGIILLTVPTIQYGGYYLLQILSGQNNIELTNFQQSMFRAGHAHAGVLVLLSLLAQIFVDHAFLNSSIKMFVRLAFPLSAILVSGGFFAAAAGKSITEPTKLIGILYVGIFTLLLSLVTLGIGLIKSK